ncbi:hypothetical protein [Streptomyces virginiae]|uniref:hypothetical protein n=1 Tax=Streptomyces virginiae TaxID=1961 RepID=UPI003665ED85
MSDLHRATDHEFAAVATLADALYALVSGRGPLPSRDIHGDDMAEWTIVLRPAADQVQGPAAPTTVRVSVGPQFTDVDVLRPAEGFRTSAGVREVSLPAELIRPLTRLVMDLVHHEEAAHQDRGLCQFCGKGRALSVWRPR